MNNLKKSLGIVGVALGTLVTASAAQAALVVIPTDLNPGDQYRLVFVTDGTWDAMRSNIDDYNTFVKTQATGGTAAIDTALDLALSAAKFDPNAIEWKVVGSTEAVAARDNTGTNPFISPGVPIYNLDGKRVADNNADLWDGSIQVAIDRTQLDTLPDPLVSPLVWTGSHNDGTPLNCPVWGSCPNGYVGMLVLGAYVGFQCVGGATGGEVWRWISNGVDWFDNSHLFYGMSPLLTVPTPSWSVNVPEPSSLLGCITLGSLMLGVAVRKATK